MVETPESNGGRINAHMDRAAARTKSSANGTQAKSRIQRADTPGTGSGSASAQPQSHAATSRSGTTGYQSLSQLLRSISAGLASAACGQGQDANGCSAMPPRSMIKTVSSDSRSMLRPPPLGDSPLELLEQSR